MSGGVSVNGSQVTVLADVVLGLSGILQKHAISQCRHEVQNHENGKVVIIFDGIAAETIANVADELRASAEFGCVTRG
jgi:hypothetical protein